MLNRSADLDAMFQALADPTRRAVISRLARGPASVSELAKPLKMSLPAITPHLRLLEESGFVVSEKVGRVRTCRIQPKRLAAAQSWLAKQRAAWEARFDRMDKFILEQTNDDD
ncbi:MAG: helix-turn-helix transcriptional regulator [Hydrogenophilaceae bacterium]|jgi:DNA-binding transcriptional ArsR family regulator|nr:helix-turn-helix transcriptional regulator [Hydrogenophilaceae bacterium]